MEVTVDDWEADKNAPTSPNFVAVRVSEVHKHGAQTPDEVHRVRRLVAHLAVLIKGFNLVAYDSA
jgi:hypothetical protein